MSIPNPALRLLLSLETSGPVCSVALHQAGQLVAYSELAQEKSHSGMLTRLIDDTLHHAQFSLADLTAVAVSAGPGSYTGLRIGVSTAKGLCFARGLPLLAVDTLKAMALPVTQMALLGDQAVFCPMTDARRMEVYLAQYDYQLRELRPTQAHILTEHSLEREVEEGIVLIFGSGAAKCKELLPYPNLWLVDNQYPTAKAVGELALANPQPVDLAYFEPAYIKPFFTTAQPVNPTFGNS
jgi:tRNA threonylcarbamoyladenosine biosynthesis protein TsaB